MKRGRRRPNVATRWVMGETVGPLYPPPMYVKVDFTALLVYPRDDPDPIPVPITGADCTVGMYSYETGDAACVWAGEWSNFWGDGDWHFGQSLSAAHGCQTHFAIYDGHPSSGSLIYTASNPDDQNGIWNDAFSEPHGAVNWRMPSYPFVFLSFNSVNAVDYADLSTMRYPTRPNKPWTFVYDP